MKLLALDTSTKSFSLAVVDNHKVLAKKDIILNKILSESIVPIIDKILAKAKVPLNKLDGFAIGLGPGSFTSLRVGLSTVKALALVTDRPVVGIASLDAIAQAVLKDSNPENIVVISDAKRGLVYACFYRNKNGTLLRAGKYLLQPVAEILSKIKSPTTLAGDALVIFQKEITQTKKAKIILAEEKLWYPKAVHLSQLAYQKFLKKEYNDVNSLVPLYLYPEHCQVVPHGRQVQNKK